MVWKLEC